MKHQQLNLLDFGYNDNGDFVNLVEEQAKNSEIAKEEFDRKLKENENPLVRILADLWCGRFEDNTFNETLDQVERESKTKCYHYGNLDKLMFIYTITTDEGYSYFIFENENHYLLFLHGFESDLLDDYLTGKNKLNCAALGVLVYDKQGYKIWQFGEKEKDIRYQCIINEWQMNKFGENRINKGKKIKDFCEIEFSLPKLIEYWGESEKV